ncbi:GGDEF domain-containing protein [Motiliproteus sediminis]|uniref:GGDEF domain-containing protein n=1 Tax=Motiliproteus sediminis TaxID=1468178 RepID=UPI001AEFC2F6|nr:diguanylate cyclase [Motiliproteus sediminis]
MISKSRSVYTVLTVGILLSIATGTWVYELESERLEAQFLVTAKEKVAAVNLQINEGFAVVDYVRIVVEESEPDGESLRHIFQRFHTQSPLLNGIAWARLEQHQGRLSLPVMLVEPVKRYSSWLGHDLALVPDFLQSARPVLAGEQLTQVLSVKNPVGDEQQITLTRTHSVEQDSFGLIVALLDIPALLENAVGQVPLRGALIELTIESANLGQRSFRWPGNQLPKTRSGLYYETVLENPAHIPLRARVMPLQSYFDQRQTMTGWLTALFGIALTLLVTLYLSSQVRLRREMERLSLTDALTGIANRRQFDQCLAREWQASRRSQEPISLLLIDIDHFKRFNDHYGHDAGDDCLAKVAQLLSNSIARPRDLLARFGGEEFAVILPSTDESAQELAERCRLAIEQAQIPHQGAPDRTQLTLSIGCATLRAKAHQSPDTLIKLADEALYHAKDRGRNRIEVATLSKENSAGTGG